MLETLRRIILVTGHYGCGKTNLAINLAADLAAEGRKVVLCDLDIVNPYFRSADFGSKAQEMGIEMIVPPFARTNVDAPVVNPRLDGAIRQRDRQVVIDVGGDDAGAAAVGRYSRAILEQGEYTFLYVINHSRPLVADPADPNVFAFVERWRDQQALDAHNRSGHFQTIVPQMKALRQPAGSQTTIYRSL